MKSIIVIIIMLLTCIAGCFAQTKTQIDSYPARNFQSVLYEVEVKDFWKDGSKEKIVVSLYRGGLMTVDTIQYKELQYSRHIGFGGYSAKKDSFEYIFDSTRKLVCISQKLISHTNDINLIRSDIQVDALTETLRKENRAKRKARNEK